MPAVVRARSESGTTGAQDCSGSTGSPQPATNERQVPAKPAMLLLEKLPESFSRVAAWLAARRDNNGVVPPLSP